MYVYHDIKRALVKGLSDLILAVMVGSEAVLFHREMMSSVGLMDMTTSHISSPTMNCSPKMASSCMTGWDKICKCIYIVCPVYCHKLSCLSLKVRVREGARAEAVCNHVHV